MTGLGGKMMWIIDVCAQAPLHVCHPQMHTIKEEDRFDSLFGKLQRAITSSFVAVFTSNWHCMFLDPQERHWHHQYFGYLRKSQFLSIDTRLLSLRLTPIYLGRIAEKVKYTVHYLSRLRSCEERREQDGKLEIPGRINKDRKRWKEK